MSAPRSAPVTAAVVVPAGTTAADALLAAGVPLDGATAAVVVRDGTASPRDWLDRAMAIEAAAGRVRDPERRFGPRTLDVDVIAVGGADDQPVISDDPELTLPHPRAHLRAFVLRPWIDIQPYGQLPGHGWLTDLLDDPALADDLAGMTPRPDLPLESDA